MTATPMPLLEVDEARITTVMDNSVDMLMASTEVARRFPLSLDFFAKPQPVGEHGFSALVQAKRGDSQATVLFDSGLSPNGLVHNLDVLQVPTSDLQAIVLSHGHPDHSLGLSGLMSRLGRRRLPLVLHPEAHLERKLVLPNGVEVNIPPPRQTDLRSEGIELIEEPGPSMIVDGMVLVSGEVPRTTEFEKGFPVHFAKRNDAWEPDPLIRDDQCAVLNVRGKGLVILSGCAHAGIVNIVRAAQALTGVQRVHAIIGGFHLTGGLFEPIIPATIAALQDIAPDHIIPGHCTGVTATHRIAAAMPQAFIANSVGTTFVL
jgi:7,8-dihydropterin-6-yl-methyl-4-(beta-D-ribofuranosyl)aminobenzene 5'-phosphate synthase